MPSHISLFLRLSIPQNPRNPKPDLHFPTLALGLAAHFVQLPIWYAAVTLPAAVRVCLTSQLNVQTQVPNGPKLCKTKKGGRQKNSI